MCDTYGLLYTSVWKGFIYTYALNVIKVIMVVILKDEFNSLNMDDKVYK